MTKFQEGAILVVWFNNICKSSLMTLMKACSTFLKLLYRTEVHYKVIFCRQTIKTNPNEHSTSIFPNKNSHFLWNTYILNSIPILNNFYFFFSSFSGVDSFWLQNTIYVLKSLIVYLISFSVKWVIWCALRALHIYWLMGGNSINCYS